MNITINGNSKQYPNPVLLTELVSQLCKNPKYIIAEVNGEIIKSDQWAHRTVNDGDTVELVGFVGGG